MSKWLLFLLITGLLAFLLYRRRRVLRRRLRFALWVGFALYATIFAWRLIARPPSDSELLTLAEIIAGFGVLWLVLWLVGGRRMRQRR